MAETNRAAKAWAAFVGRYPPKDRTAFGKRDAWAFCNGYAAAESESVNAALLAACKAALEDYKVINPLLLESGNGIFTIVAEQLAAAIRLAEPTEASD